MKKRLVVLNSDVACPCTWSDSEIKERLWTRFESGDDNLKLLPAEYKIFLDRRAVGIPQLATLEYTDTAGVTYAATTKITLLAMPHTKVARPTRTVAAGPWDAYTPTAHDKTAVVVTVLGEDGGIFCSGGSDVLRCGTDIKSSADWSVYFVSAPDSEVRPLGDAEWAVMTESPSGPCVCGVDILANVGGKAYSCTRAVTFATVAGEQHIRITPTVLPVAFVGMEYNTTLDIDASDSYTTSATGHLPSGLRVYGNKISGIPSEIGEFSFTITAELADGMSDSATFDLTVKPVVPGDAPAISSTSLPDGQVGVYYEKTLEYTGSEPIQWTAASLPDGMQIDESGTVYGYPYEKFTGTFHVSAKNAYGQAESDIALTIAPAGDAPRIVTTSLPDGIVYTSYRVFLRAEGTEPITWSATNLPAGLKIVAISGAILGTPTETGTFDIAVTATNAAGSTTSVLRMSVRSSSHTSPAITTSELPSASLGTPYTAAISAIGSTPITWFATNLPTGLVMGRESGLIFGTPNTSGEFTVVVTATNAYGEDTKTFELEVSGGHGLVVTPHKTEYAYGESIGPNDVSVFYAGEKLRWHEFKLVYDRYKSGQQTVIVGYNSDPYKLEPIITGSYRVSYGEPTTRE